MNLFNSILFRNHARHQESCEGSGILLYAMNGSLYFRINGGTPHLFGGVIIPNGSTSGLGGDIRHGTYNLRAGVTETIAFSPFYNLSTYEVHLTAIDGDGNQQTVNLVNNSKTNGSFQVISPVVDTTLSWLLIL